MSREEAATKAGMRHYGYTDEQIAFAEQPEVHAEECEFIEQVGWQCISEDGKPIHPESVELNAEFEMAQVHIEAADAHDQANGIHRIALDEKTVERAARGMFAEEQCDRRQKLDVEGNWTSRLDDRDRDEYRRLTRAALAAAVKEEQA
jgi:hypothetical protein